MGRKGSNDGIDWVLERKCGIGEEEGEGEGGDGRWVRERVRKERVRRRAGVTSRVPPRDARSPNHMIFSLKKLFRDDKRWSMNSHHSV